jgi:hypothetical protein
MNKKDKKGLNLWEFATVVPQTKSLVKPSPFEPLLTAKRKPTSVWDK